MNSEQCSLVVTDLSFCSCPLLGILNVWVILQWDSISIVILLCIEVHYFWDELRSWSVSAIFLRSLLSFLCFQLSYLLHHFSFYYISFSLPLTLFQVFPFCLFAFPIYSLFQMKLTDFLFFIWNVFTLAYRIWITTSPSLFQVAAVWQCYKKPQWHQCWWQNRKMQGQESLWLCHIHWLYFLEYVQGSSSLGHFCMDSLWHVYL